MTDSCPPGSDKSAFQTAHNQIKILIHCVNAINCLKIYIIEDRRYLHSFCMMIPIPMNAILATSPCQYDKVKQSKQQSIASFIFLGITTTVFRSQELKSCHIGIMRQCSGDVLWCDFWLGLTHQLIQNPYFFRLKILKFIDVVTYIIGIFIYKVFHQDIPRVFKKYHIENRNVHDYATRQVDHIHIAYVGTNRRNMTKGWKYGVPLLTKIPYNISVYIYIYILQTRI